MVRRPARSVSAPLAAGPARLPGSLISACRPCCVRAHSRSFAREIVGDCLRGCLQFVSDQLAGDGGGSFALCLVRTSPGGLRDPATAGLCLSRRPKGHSLGRADAESRPLQVSRQWQAADQAAAGGRLRGRFASAARLIQRIQARAVRDERYGYLCEGASRPRLCSSSGFRPAAAAPQAAPGRLRAPPRSRPGAPGPVAPPAHSAQAPGPSRRSRWSRCSPDSERLRMPPPAGGAASCSGAPRGSGSSKRPTPASRPRAR